MKLECPIVLKHAETSQKPSKSYSVQLNPLQRLNAVIEGTYPWVQVQTGTIQVRQKDIESIYDAKKNFILLLKRHSVLFQIVLKKSDYHELLQDNKLLIQKNNRSLIFKTIVLGQMPIHLSLGMVFTLLWGLNLYFSEHTFKSELCSDKCAKAAESLFSAGIMIPSFLLATILLLFLTTFVLKKTFPYRFVNITSTNAFVALAMLALPFNLTSVNSIKGSLQTLSLHLKGSLSEDSLRALLKKQLPRNVAGESKTK